jgi:anaerobic ribonucleoside-triphosphate reductase
MELVKNANKICHDCKKNVKNGVLLVYDDLGDKIKVLKCKKCYEKNPSLQNFRKCEVYSRVVGYLRPVTQWNFGKQREYEERKEYRVSSACCD